MIDWVLPILYWAISPGLLDSTTTLRSLLIPIISFYLFTKNPIKLQNFKIPFAILILITLGYIISWQLNNQNLVNFLFGAYGRGLGIITLIGVFLFFILCAENYGGKIQRITQINYLVLIFCVSYVVIQIIGIDPLPWEKGAGPGGTLGNPNFSSALMGILSVVPLHYILNSKTKSIMHVLIYFITFLAIYQTNSRQGIVLFFLGLISSLILHSLKKQESKLNMKWLYVGAASVVITGLFILTKYFDQIDSALQIRNRIEHWKMGYQIWQDYPLFGVGVDNIQRYGGEYRNLQMREWGLDLIPDRLHNTFIDYFVTGGVIVGFLWIFFVMFTLIQVYKCFNNKYFHQDIIPLALIWILYLIQCSFSPDQLVIMMSAISAIGSLSGLVIKKNVR